MLRYRMKAKLLAAIMLALISACSAWAQDFQSAPAPAASKPTPVYRPAKPPPPVELGPPSQPVSSEAEHAWLATKDSTSPAILQAFITHFAGTPYADLARARLNELQAAAAAEAAKAPRFLGCFHDQASSLSGLFGGIDGRDLDGFSTSNSGMSTEQCLALCRQRGFAYAGTQDSSYCFCGNAYGRSGRAENCTMPCDGNKSEICGGAWANSVYQVPVESGTMRRLPGQ